jgi:hypothetical protein
VGGWAGTGGGGGGAQWELGRAQATGALTEGTVEHD